MAGRQRPTTGPSGSTARQGCWALLPPLRVSLFPAGTDGRIVAALAAASAAGVPFVLGVLVLLVALALAPRRRRRELLDARLDRIEAKAAGPASPSQFHFTGGNQSFYFGPQSQSHAPGLSIGPAEDIQLDANRAGNRTESQDAPGPDADS